MEEALVTKECMEDALVKALETQREGVEEFSSSESDDGDILDLYGRPRVIHGADDLNKNKSKCLKKCQCFKRYDNYKNKVLIILLYFMILIFVASIWFAVKQKEKYTSYKFLFVWREGGWFVIPMLILFIFDPFLSFGVM